MDRTYPMPDAVKTDTLDFAQIVSGACGVLAVSFCFLLLAFCL